MKKVLVVAVVIFSSLFFYNLGLFLGNEQIYNNRFAVEEQEMRKILQQVAAPDVSIRRGSKGEAALIGQSNRAEYTKIESLVKEKFGEVYSKSSLHIRISP